ncbi:phage head morphogenesis protein [Acidimangrovimonas sediminis]|uniref:phage head morphogenesis protein n=1 Tax=Acidimangrovimonas sediminis TaxID=2056283 RepID=UPI000C8054D7|nr:phage minor head protein [Acidimangrovimonas sediminis]
MADPILGILGKPFAEQVAAFRLRLGNLVPTARWDDIQTSAHDTGYMVAGAAKADLLADLAGATDKAISAGTSLEEFRRDFRQIVERHGWHGWTGEDTAAGRAWRTRVIYRTNMSTTYAAGRHAQLTEGGFPLWVYRHGASREPRILHLSWNGLVLAPDHAFWKAHYPPSDWGCSCYVIGARSKAGARRVGGDPDKPLPDNWDRIDPKTGTPVGIGKGWDYAPGASVTRLIPAMRDKLEQLPDRPSIDLIQSWLTSNGFRSWLATPQGAFPIARAPAEVVARLSSDRAVVELTAQAARSATSAIADLSGAQLTAVQSLIANPARVVADGAAEIYVGAAGPDGTALAIRVVRAAEGLEVTRVVKMSRPNETDDQTIIAMMEG